MLRLSPRDALWALLAARPPMIDYAHFIGDHLILAPADPTRVTQVYACGHCCFAERQAACCVCQGAVRCGLCREVA